MKTIIKIIFVMILFVLTSFVENSIMPTVESQVALKQFSSNESSAVMRSYGTWRNWSFLMYGVPLGIGCFMFRKEIGKVFK